jgi:predicted TIM-barrel fold metal-dependent hydrolase
MTQAAGPDDLLISSDSHVIEDPDLWARHLPACVRDHAPTYEHFSARKSDSRRLGGSDPVARLSEMEVDGVSCEVLYPTLALDQFGIAYEPLQQACFRVYNDWLMEYCSYSPERLLGLACISAFDMRDAVDELERCRNGGLRGALIWQVPPAGLSFSGPHYDPFWAAAQDLAMPVSLHILTGEPYKPGLFAGERHATPLQHIKDSVDQKLFYAGGSLLDVIGSGVFDRYPNLNVVLVENEVSWLPFVTNQWDKYIGRGGKYTIPAKELPSFYFGRNVFATFFNDQPSRWMLADWQQTCMWSNDYPHPNSTWPNSREVIRRDLGHLPSATRAKLLSENVAKLYEIDLAALAAVPIAGGA